MHCSPSVTAAAQCATQQSGYSNSYRTDITEQLNDFGRIHADAEDSGCAEAAMNALINKVTNTLAQTPTYGKTDPVTGWLKPFDTALMFAAAVRIGANGWAMKGLDYVGSTAVLRGIENRIYNNSGFWDEPCSPERNTCMEEHAGKASAYAWIAAYKYRRGDIDYALTWFRNQAIYHIQTALSPSVVCLHNATEFAADKANLCTGDMTELRNGTAKTLTLNGIGAFESPTYGFGQMTSIAFALQGLDAANSGHSFTADQQDMAQGLFKEMQSHVDTSPHPDVFKSDCRQVTFDSGTGKTGHPRFIRFRISCLDGPS